MRADNKVPPEMITARITMVGFFALVLKRGSGVDVMVGDGDPGVNLTGVF